MRRLTEEPELDDDDDDELVVSLDSDSDWLLEPPVDCDVEEEAFLAEWVCGKKRKNVTHGTHVLGV